MISNMALKRGSALKLYQTEIYSTIDDAIMKMVKKCRERGDNKSCQKKKEWKEREEKGRV